MRRLCFTLLLTLGGLFIIAHPAYALFGIADVGIFDIPSMALDALDFVDNVIMKFLIGSFILFTVSQVLLTSVAGILQWASGLQIPLEQELVVSGWTFMTGVVNLALLVIFMIVAFSSILRIETFQMKKTLPRLIIIALLVNFSRLFVGIFADIAQVLINTVQTAWGGNFVSLSLAPLKEMWGPPLAFAVSFIAVKVGLAMVPIANVVSAAATTGLFITDLVAGKGWALQLIVLAIFNVATTLVFLLFSLLFVARVAVIGILTIIAPLAFVAAVLPGTQKYWSQWLQALISWSFVGVMALFLMGLGLQFFSTVISGAPDFGLNLGKNLFSIIFLLTYLGAAFFISIKTMPAAAQGIVNVGSKLGLMGAMGLGSALARRIPLGKFGENIRKRAQGIEVKEEEKTRMERIGAAVLGTIPGMSRLGSAINVPVLQTRKNEAQARIDELEEKKRKNHGRLGKKDTAELDQKNIELQNINTQISTASAGMLTQGLARFARRGARVIGGGMEMVGKELDIRTGAKDEREYQQGVKDVGSKDSFHVFNMVNEELAKGPLANQNRIVGMLNGVRNRGDGDDIEDALKSGQLDKKVIGTAIKTGRRMGPPGFRPLLKTFMGDIMVNPQEYGFAATRDKTTGKWEGKDAELLTGPLGIERLPTKFSAEDFKGDTIAPQNFNMDTEQGRLFMQLMIKERGADFMGQIGRRPRKEESRAIMDYIFKEGRHAQTGLGINWLLDNNAEDVLRYLDSPGARSIGLGRNITREEIERLIAQKKRGQTPPQLLEEVVLLEEQLKETTGRRRTIIQRHIDQINTRIGDMEKSPAVLQEEATRQQAVIQRVNVIAETELTLENIRSRVAAERRFDQIQQELSLKGIILSTTPQEQSYTTLLGQRAQLQTRLQEQQRQQQDELSRIATRRQQLLQEIERAQQEMLTTPGLPADYVANLQQQIPLAQQDLANIEASIERERRRFESEIQQTTQQLRQADTAIGRIEIELGRVPEPPAPLPKIQPAMPDPLKRLINQGGREVETITKKTRELQGNLTDIRKSQEDLAEVTQAMTRLNEELRKLNVQNQAGTPAPELQARIPGLEGEIQRLQERETFHSQQINTYQGMAAKAREEILTSKQKVDGPDGIRKRIGAQTEPLQRKYERTKRSQRREQRLKQG